MDASWIQVRVISMRAIRTLIVDDNEDFRNRLHSILDEQDEIEVVGEAGDGHEAVEMATALNPDLVLIDIRMPRLNGLQAIGRMKHLKNIKTIVLTAYDLQEYRQAAREMGAGEVIIKKSMVKELLPAIRRVMGTRTD